MTFFNTFVVVPEKRFGFGILTNSSSFIEGAAGIFQELQSLLLGHSIPEPRLLDTNLPHASAVNGNYFTARRDRSTLMEGLFYIRLPIIRVSAVNARTIRYTAGDISATYNQIEPFVFRLERMSGFGVPTELRFRIEEGYPSLILKWPEDAVGITTGRLTASAVSIIFCGLYFLLVPFVILRRFIDRWVVSIAITRFEKLCRGFLLTGTLLFLNNLFVIIRIFHDFFRTSGQLMPHIWVNYLLTGLAIALFVGALLHYHKKETEYWSQTVFLITAPFMGLLVFLLYNWNFYALL
jgi:hypothetical protein